MDIKYLKTLEEVLVTNNSLPNIPISPSEIEALETKYNSGDRFPRALRELLSLAGDFCYVLDYGIYDTQDEFQEKERTILSANNCSGINRPFYVIDCTNDFDQFVFIYLDEGDDPPVYFLSMEDCSYRQISETLKLFIDTRIARVKSGMSPF